MAESTKKADSNPYGPAFIAIQPPLPKDFNSADLINLTETLIEVEQYDYVLLPITTPQYHSKCEILASTTTAATTICGDLQESVPDVTKDDLAILKEMKKNDRIAGVSSPYNDTSRSSDIIMKELEYAKYIGLKEFIIPRQEVRDVVKFGTFVNKILTQTRGYGMVIILEVSGGGDDDCDWDSWNTIRGVCQYDSRLKLKLDLDLDLGCDGMRWFCEPVSMIRIPNQRWLKNSNGFDVLSPSDQEFLLCFQYKKPLLIIDVLEQNRQRYLTHLISQKHKPLGTMDRFAFHHNDVLLPPLQPLATNLDNHTYEVFGQDPVKYEKYKGAIKLALHNLIEKGQPGLLNIAMVGAGTGLIVDQLIKVIDELGIGPKVGKLSILEKNPCALIDLHLKYDTISLPVEIIAQDMRSWNPPQAYHLIVSELLGSFGCNELSPECLSSLHQDLHPQGVMIPQSYESWCSLAAYPKLYQMLQHGDRINMEKHFVVRPKEYQLLAAPQKLWSFHHPYVNSFQQSTTVQFPIHHKTTIHAIMGYFNATLYGTITINNMLDTGLETPDMTSWFPIVFPVQLPQYVMDQSVVDVTMSRNVDGVRVWYEWALQSSCWLEVGGKKHNNQEQLKRVKVKTGQVVCGNLNGVGFFVDAT